MAVKGTLTKVSNPREGLTQAEYEAICAALGWKPEPEPEKK